MLDYKRIIGMYYSNGHSGREIAESLQYSKSTVNEFLRRFEESKKLSYPLAPDISNEVIGYLLYSKRGGATRNSGVLYRQVDCEEIQRKLRSKGETLKHLWRKYNAIGEVEGKAPYSYRQYCQKYTEWARSKNITAHIDRQPGVNTELDFAGQVLYLSSRYNKEEKTRVPIFVSTLSFSKFFYLEGLEKGDARNWIGVNNNSARYFDGLTQVYTPDNCKVAVLENKDWIDPLLNKDFQEWAAHNDVAILPAKPVSPKYKPNVENTVGLVTSHILIDMLEMTFYSLDELNTELWKRMEEENKVNFQGCSYSRWDLYTNEEKDTLLPLPATEYQFLERKTVKVYQDFSFVFEEVHYTMPRKYLKDILEVRANATTLHVYNEDNDFIRDHVRSYKRKSWVIIDEDLPLEYRDYGKWSVPFFQSWANSVGPYTKMLIDRLLAEGSHPVFGFRFCLGVLAHAKKSKPALEACCQEAVSRGRCSYGYVKNTFPGFLEAEVKKNQEAPTGLANGLYKADDSKYSFDVLKGKEGKDGCKN